MTILAKPECGVVLITIIFECVNSFKCPLNTDKQSEFTAGSSGAFDDTIACSYHYLSDIKLDKSILFSSGTKNCKNNINFRNKVHFNSGHVFGHWSYSRWYKTIWWCSEDQSHIFLASYIVLTGAGIDTLFSVDIDTPPPTLHCSAKSNPITGNVRCIGNQNDNKLSGRAQYSAQLVDGILVFQLHKGASKIAKISDLSLYYFTPEHRNIGPDNYIKFTVQLLEERNHFISCEFKEYIECLMRENLLALIKQELIDAITKCLPVTADKMSNFDATKTVPKSEPNRIEKILDQLKTIATRNTQQNPEMEKFQNRVINEQKETYEEMKQRAALLLEQSTPFTRKEITRRTPARIPMFTRSYGK